MTYRERDPLPHRHEIHKLASPPRGWGCHRSGHALKPPGVSGCRSLAGAAVPHPASGSTRPAVAAPLVFTAARPPPAPRREALPPSAARHPRPSDSIPRGIWAALCRRPCQCRLPPARPRKPARGRRTAWHRTGALAGPGAGLPDASRLLLPPPRSSASPPLPTRLERRAPITSSNPTATFPRINPPAPSQTEKLLGRKKILLHSL